MNINDVLYKWAVPGPPFSSHPALKCSDYSYFWILIFIMGSRRAVLHKYIYRKCSTGCPAEVYLTLCWQPPAKSKALSNLSRISEHNNQVTPEATMQTWFEADECITAYLLKKLSKEIKQPTHLFKVLLLSSSSSATPCPFCSNSEV